jgi:hypothetical protein
MNGELQYQIETTVDQDTAKALNRYCTIHGIKKRDALRKAIALLLAGNREPPKLDPDVPL